MPNYSELVFGFQGIETIMKKIQGTSFYFGYEEHDDNPDPDNLLIRNAQDWEAYFPCLGLTGDFCIPYSSPRRFDWIDASGIEMYSTTSEQDDKVLEQAWLASIAELGLSVTPRKNEYGRIEYVLNDPYNYEISPFSWMFSFDPHECGDDLDTATFGINLTSRYSPVFLDYTKKHGGMVKMNNAHIEIAKKHIIKAMPIFADADIIVKNMFA